MEEVVLVSKADKDLGKMEKLEAHQLGRLHRAITVFLYRDNEKGKEVLVQKRGWSKPLWPGFWADTVSTHPRWGESYIDCGVRRLKEEMGISLHSRDLRLAFKLYYRARYNKDLSEHEVDGILVGHWNGKPRPDGNEVAGFRWVGWQDLLRKSKKASFGYAPWVGKAMVDKRLQQILEMND